MSGFKRKKITDWNKDDIRVFHSAVLKQLQNVINNITKIRKIFCVGSRAVKEIDVFTENSDLNLLVYVTDPKFHKETYEFSYLSLHVKVLLLDVKTMNETLGKYRGFELPYFDLTTQTYNSGNILDVIHYYTTIKPKQFKTKCFKCNNETNSFSHIRYFNEKNKKLLDRIIPVCNTCFNKIKQEVISC